MDDRFKRVGSLSLTGHWPNFPLTYTTGDFDLERRSFVATSDGSEIKVSCSAK